MRTVSVTETKNHLDLLLEWVRQGEGILLLDRGARFPDPGRSP
ncbi:MAG: hypothetical protein WHT26_11440 [Thermus sp.]